MGGWKQGGPRLPCSSLRSAKRYSSMCEPAGSMCAPKQVHTDIMCAPNILTSYGSYNEVSYSRHCNPLQFASEMRQHFMSTLQMGNQGMLGAPVVLMLSTQGKARCRDLPSQPRL